MSSPKWPVINLLIRKWVLSQAEMLVGITFYTYFEYLLLVKLFQNKRNKKETLGNKITGK